MRSLSTFMASIWSICEPKTNAISITCKSWIDLHIDDKGTINRPINALDYMLPGNLLLILYKETKQEKYKLAANNIRKVFNTYPRTKDGGFWHAETQSRQWQLWADGVFMSLPFLARYGQMFGDSAYANDEVDETNADLLQAPERSGDWFAVACVRRKRRATMGRSHYSSVRLSLGPRHRLVWR